MTALFRIDFAAEMHRDNRPRTASGAQDGMFRRLLTEPRFEVEVNKHDRADDHARGDEGRLPGQELGTIFVAFK